MFLINDSDISFPVILPSFKTNCLPNSPHRSLSSGPALYHSNNELPASSNEHLSSKIYGVSGEP